MMMAQEYMFQDQGGQLYFDLIFLAGVFLLFTCLIIWIKIKITSGFVLLRNNFDTTFYLI